MHNELRYELPYSPVYYELKIDIPVKDMKYFSSSVILLDKVNKEVLEKLCYDKVDIAILDDVTYTVRVVFVDSEEFARWITYIKLSDIQISAKVFEHGLYHEFRYLHR